MITTLASFAGTTAALLSLLAGVSTVHRLKTPGPIAGKKIALLVGVEQYDRADFSRINFAIKDVQDTAKCLTRLGFDARTMTSDEKSSYSPARPTSTNVLKQLAQIATELGPDDTFVFYFDGHAITKGASGYLATANCDPSSDDTLTSTSIPVATLNAQLGKIPCKQMAVIMDAGHTGGQPGVNPTDSTLTGDFAKSVCGIEGVRTGAGATVVLFSCDVGEAAFEDPDLGHSVFAASLQHALAGDPTKVGDIDIASVAEAVKKSVGDWGTQHARKQSPWLDSGGDTHIVLGTLPAATAAEPILAVKTVAATGTLSVTSDPLGANILIDDEDTGKVTPATIDIEAPVDGKTVKVRLQKLGCASAECEVTVERGKTAKVSATLPNTAPQPAATLAVRFSRTDFPDYPFIRMFDGSFNLALIASEQDVQREVGIDKTQKNFKQFEKAVRDVMKLATPDLVHAKTSRLTRDEVQRVADCLTPYQQAVLWKIMLRRTGVEAVADPSVAGALGLDDAQKRDLSGNFSDFTEANTQVMKKILTGHVRKKEMEDLMVQAAKNRELLDDTVSKILKRDQIIRLQQLQELQ